MNRTRTLVLLLTVFFFAAGTTTAQKRILILSWNVESDGNDAHTIAKQLADFEGFDLLGITEVREGNAAKYAEAAGAGEGAKGSSKSDFKHVVSESGDKDRMMIVWDNKRFEKIGDKTELAEFDDGSILHELNNGTHRSPMFCRFKIRETDIEFLFMVNHLARGNAGLRNSQATGLRAWAQAQDVPVIAVGDYNFDFSVDDGQGNQGFQNMLEGDTWKWVRPDRLYKTQLSPKYNGVLDFIFTAKTPDNWQVDSWIRTDVVRAVNDERNSDHRPLVGRVLISVSD